MKIGVLGPKGTFSDLALHKYKKDHAVTPYYYQTLNQTVTSLERLDRIIVPLENTLEGYVQPILDFMISQDVHIESELTIPVQYAFVTNVTDLKDVKNVFVQFAAKSQCQKFINHHNFAVTLTESNVQSYQRIIAGEETDGAIIPIHLVTKSFKTKHENITDTENNQTRFIVLSKTFNQQYAERFKFSLVVRPTLDRSGLLFDILEIFKNFNINLTAIMSRPQKTRLGQYYFYIEFEGESDARDTVMEALTLMRQNFDVKLLGVYPHPIKKVSV